MSSSPEGRLTSGFNFFDYEALHFSDIKTSSPALKIPHIGFNSVDTSDLSILFQGLPSQSDFYFVHSYCVPLDLTLTRKEEIVSSTMHGTRFISAIEQKNIFGVQFHPEKSQSNGLKLLANFYNYNSNA